MPRGYPDWQRVVDWVSDVLLVNETSHAQVVGTEFIEASAGAAFEVSRWHGFSARVQAIGKGLVFRVTYYTDVAETRVISEYNVHVPAGYDAELHRPHMSPFLTISLIRDPSAGAASHHLYFQLHNRNIGTPVISDRSLLIAATGVNVAGAGGQDQKNGTQVFAGTSFLMVTTGMTDYLFDVHSIDYTGAATLILRRKGPEDGKTFANRLNIPAAGLRTTMTNNDAAAALYSTAIVADYV